MSREVVAFCWVSLTPRGRRQRQASPSPLCSLGSALVRTLKPTSHLLRCPGLEPARAPRAQRLPSATLARAPHSPPAAERPPGRPTGPPCSRQRRAFRQLPETRSPGTAAFRLPAWESQPASARRGRTRVCLCECAGVLVCARAGRGEADHRSPLAPILLSASSASSARGCRLRRVQVSGSPVCLMKGKEQKAGGRGQEGGWRGGEGARRACSEQDTERSRGQRARRRGDRTAPTRAPRAARSPRWAAGKPDRKCAARDSGTPRALQAGGGIPTHPRRPF